MAQIVGVLSIQDTVSHLSVMIKNKVLALDNQGVIISMFTKDRKTWLASLRIFPTPKGLWKFQSYRILINIAQGTEIYPSLYIPIAHIFLFHLLYVFWSLCVSPLLYITQYYQYICLVVLFHKARGYLLFIPQSAWNLLGKVHDFLQFFLPLRYIPVRV